MGVHFQVQESSEGPRLSGAFAFRSPMSRSIGKDAFNFFSVTITGTLVLFRKHVFLSVLLSIKAQVLTTAPKHHLLCELWKCRAGAQNMYYV